MAEVFRPRQPEITRGIEGELPESKIFDLLSSVGNGEHKALELIAMREGVIYSRNALYQEIMDHQEQNNRWKMSKSTPFDHCSDSLSSIGLVTRETLSPDGSAWGYQITEYGLRTGVPFAGALLKWSHEHPDFSLHKMFGSTQSKIIRDEQSLDKKRAQETRYKIFWEISTNPTNRIRTTDIANGINEGTGHTHSHLMPLKKNGVIFYESVEHGQPAVYFKLKEGVPTGGATSFSADKSLSEGVYDLIRQRYRVVLSGEEIANMLIQQYPKYRDLSKKYLITRISNILSYFEKQGYVEREKFSRYFKSEIALSDEQRRAVLSLVNFIDNFKNGDIGTIKEGKEFAQRALNDPKLFSELMLKAKEASPYANLTSREDTYSYIISIIQDNPDSTASHIMQRLGENYDIKLMRYSVLELLRNLTREGRIASAKTKYGNVYRVADADKETVPSQN